MNPAHSLAAALLSSVLVNLWLYWSATFVGTSIIAFIIKGKFMKNDS
jgi:aquaporin Z